jgi:adenine-specific DNA-methyltransferase
MSDYCRVNAPKVFKDLIDNLKGNYIVVSYNNTYNSKSNSSKNKIGLEEIKNILNKKGHTEVFRRNYRYFNSGKTSFENHQEYLFITKVKKWRT